MRRPQRGLYAIALAVLVVGLVALGVPASTLLIGALVLACPLMMLTMHGGHSGHAGHGGGDDRDATNRPETLPLPPRGHDHQDHDAAGRR